MRRQNRNVNAPQNVAAERAARQFVFKPIVEPSVAAVDFRFAVAENVKSETDARSRFVAPAENDRNARGGKRRNVFFLDAETRINRQPTDRPAILNVKRLGFA